MTWRSINSQEASSFRKVRIRRIAEEKKYYGEQKIKPKSLPVQSSCQALKKVK